jgi:PilZ domain
MAERRKHPRALTFKTGKIASSNEMPAIECAVLDISAGGACLLVPDGVELPRTFVLVLDPTGTTHTCNVERTSGSRIGVSFQKLEGSNADGNQTTSKVEFD